MASIVKLTRAVVRENRRTGEKREVEETYYRARVRVGRKQPERTFKRLVDAEEWVRTTTSSVVTGTYVAPKTARTTVAEWCDEWLTGYAANRDSTVRQARVHVVRIKKQFGSQRIGDVRPTQVKAWIAALQREGLEASYIYALHARLAQIYNDAIHDGIVARSPCSRRTSPPAGEQKPYVISTEQMWSVHDAVEDWCKPAILLGALVGLRPAEACGLRTSDVDFMRRVVHPRVQFPAEPLKTKASKQPVAIDELLTLQLAAWVKARPAEWLVSKWGKQVSPWTLEREIRRVRPTIEGLPEGFTFHDLRHYLASMLIAEGLDVKTVQARMRHASARTTLDTYSHLWPETDEAARATVDKVLAARAASREGGMRGVSNPQG